MKDIKKKASGVDKDAHLVMRELPLSERPYEKCELMGAGALSQEELLAVILRHGTGKMRVTQVARSVLSKCEEYGGLAYIDRIPAGELMAIEGIGRVKALQLKCLGELSRRISASTKRVFTQRVESPADVRDFLRDELRSLEAEEVWALYLDGKNNVIKKHRITRGTVNSSLISGREVYKEAVRICAAGVILAHNHPSSDPEPSSDDIRITQVLRAAGELMDVEFIDHVIIGDQRYVSMRERGLLK